MQTTLKKEGMEIVKDVQNWFKNLGLENQDPMKQFSKCIEEVGELAEAINKSKSKDEQGKELGDVVVTLIGLSMQLDLDFYKCLEAAHKKNSARKGEVVNGLFVKSEDL